MGIAEFIIGRAFARPVGSTHPTRCTALVAPQTVSPRCAAFAASPNGRLARLIPHKHDASHTRLAKRSVAEKSRCSNVPSRYSVCTSRLVKGLAFTCHRRRARSFVLLSAISGGYCDC